MTVALSLKVNDGIVLAADSASTVIAFDATGNVVGASAVYNNANKIANLYKGLPIGTVTWGLGGIGVASMATLMKDLRSRLTGQSDRQGGWLLDPENYTIEEVAQKFYRFIYEDRYVPAFKGKPQIEPLGCFICGYSAGEEMAEEFHLEIARDGSCVGPARLQPKEEAGAISWRGSGSEALYRLLFGFSAAIPTVLEQNLGIPSDQVEPVIEVLKKRLSVQLVHPAMPIQDAIDLAEFLAHTSAQFSRFTPGPVSVGGPIEIAGITKHEGFKWIRRKYYYRRELNPEG